MSFLENLKQKTELKLTLPVSYYFKPARTPTQKTVLLLHGYQDSASSVFKRAFGESPQEFDFNILAPNGVYPVPVRGDHGFKEAYAWYFVDADRKLVLVAPEIAQLNLIELIQHLQMGDHTFLVVGFSQGGILAPFVATELRKVAGLIGIGTLFIESNFVKLGAGLPIDAIHGVDDDIIGIAKSKAGYDALKAAQPRPGEYYSFAGLKHSLDDTSRKKLRDLIDARLVSS